MTGKEFYLTKERVQAEQMRILEMCERALKASRADETEITVFAKDEALTRFANSEIHQNNFERNAQVSVRAAVGKQVATASSNLLTPEGLKQAVNDAYEMATMRAPDKDWAGLPQGPFTYPLKVDFYENTAVLTPEARAKPLLEVFKLGGETYSAAGYLSNSALTVIVANSHNVRAACNTTTAKFSVLYTGADSSGYWEDFTRNFEGIDIMASARRALEKAQASANPKKDLPAGEYVTILEDDCIANMAMFLSWMGFSAKMVQDKESFLVGKMGEKITGDNITLVDDAGDPRTMGLPFDFEGVPKQKLTLIENGIAKNYAHSWKTAKKEGAESTGHYLGMEEPLPVNMVLMPGEKSKDELIASTERGVLVSRFHYTNIVNPMETVLTGMTRDGTFLIENGKIARGLTNFRFTQNILKALADNDGLSREQRFSSAFFGGGAVVPAVKVKSFNFSGKTGF